MSGDKWFELRVTAKSVCEDGDGCKYIRLGVEVVGEDGHLDAGLYGCTVKLGKSFTVRKNSRGQWVFDGHALGAVPFLNGWLGDEEDEDGAVEGRLEGG